jgi:methyl-accepting chemotaxis protein
MVSGIQEGTQRAVGSMDAWSSRVAERVTQARGASDVMTRIHGGAAAVVCAVNEITSALKEHSNASGEIARNVERIAAMTEHNVAAANGMAVEAQGLDHLAQSLESILGRLRVQASAA